MPVADLNPLEFQGWRGNWEALWTALGAHLGSADFLLFLFLAVAILTLGVQFVYFPLFYRAHRFRAFTSIRFAWLLGVLTCLVLYLNMFWCLYAGLRNNYQATLLLGGCALALATWGILIPKRRLR